MSSPNTLEIHAAANHPGAGPPAPAPPGNWTQVDAARHGDSDAFGRLYDQYVRTVYRYVLFRVADPGLAEDLTSETFLRALRGISSVHYQGRDLAAWLLTIAKNLVLDHHKSGRSRYEVPTADFSDTRPHHHGPEQQVLTEAVRGELLRCVRQLNVDQRECIRLRFLQGLSVTETALRMHRNEGAVKALQHRAIRRLAQLFPADLR